MPSDGFEATAREVVEVVGERIRDWIRRSREQNPDSSLVVGTQFFTISQVEEHIARGTPESKKIYKIIFQEGAGRARARRRGRCSYVHHG